MKNVRLVVVGGVLVVAVVVALLRGGLSTGGSACGPYRTDQIVKIGSTEIKAEVVNTPADREKGLSGRPCIEADRGMLFVFDRPSRYAIWMKGMKFPIDVLWIGADRKVVGIEIGVDPSTYPDRFINKDKPAQYVLELQANRIKELSVNLGTQIDLGL